MLDPGRLRCPECEFTSTNEKRLVKHVRKSHGKAAVRCPLCDGVHYSSSPEKLCVHKKQQHRSVRLRCFLCEFSSRSLDRWAGHVTRVHSGHTISLVSLASRIRSSSSQCFPPEPRPIDVMGTFKNLHKVCTESQGSNSHSPADCVLVESGQSSDHANIRSEPGYTDLVPPLSPRFSCSVCGYSTLKQQNLRKHVTEKHSNLKEEIVPHHVRVEGNNKEIDCPYCNLSYPNIKKMSQHCKIEHRKDSCYLCTYCDRSFQYVSKLLRHLGVHTGEKPFACHICSLNCSSKMDLVKHIRVHTKERPYKCPYCDYAAAVKWTLINHIKIHTNERPYKCLYCDYAAAVKKTLTVHIRTHTNERPFKCQVCDYTSKEKSALIDHMRVHTKERPYQCKRCHVCFTQKSNLNTHIKKGICAK